MRSFKFFSVNLALSSVLAICVLASMAVADEDPAKPPEQKELTGTITGQMVLPSEIPEGFRGGEMSFDKAVLVIEGMYRGPRMNRPENYSKMSRDERRAWSEEYRKTEDYRRYEEARRKAYENRPVWKYPVATDGHFEVKGMKPGRYNVIPLIPHHAASGKELSGKSWGSAFRQVVITEDRLSIDVGDMKLKLKNVLMPGDMAPEWSAKGIDGRAIKSSDFKGKYVVLDFWATWCGPCIAEIPNLAKAHEEFRDDPVAVIGLSIDDNMELPKEFLQKQPSSYLQAYLGEWHDNETTTRDFGIESVPSIWLIGPDGRVIARDLGGRNITSKIRESLLKAR